MSVVCQTKSSLNFGKSVRVRRTNSPKNRGAHTPARVQTTCAARVDWASSAGRRSAAAAC
jgi:hypothetical protein